MAMNGSSHCNCEETTRYLYYDCWGFCNLTACLDNENYVVEILEWVQFSIACFGLFANLALIFCILVITRMHTNINYLLLNLSIADFLYLLLKTIWILSAKADYNLNFLSYVAFNSLVLIFSNASLVAIVAVSVERYIAVCHPFAKNNNKFLRMPFIFLAISIWSVTLVISSGWIYYNTIPDEAVYKDLSKETDYIVSFLDMIIFMLSLSIVTLMYALIVRRLRNRPEGFDAINYECIKKRTKEVTIMLLINTVIFYVCLLPYTMAYLLATAEVDYVCIYSEAVQNIARVFLFVNSAVNPIVYQVFSGEFRRAFQESFTLLFHCFIKPRQQARRSTKRVAATPSPDVYHSSHTEAIPNWGKTPPAHHPGLNQQPLTIYMVTSV